MQTFNEETTPREISTVSFFSILQPHESVRCFEEQGLRVYLRDTYEGGRTFLSAPMAASVKVTRYENGSRIDLSGPAPCEEWQGTLALMFGSALGSEDGPPLSDTLRAAWEALEGYEYASEIRELLADFDGEEYHHVDEDGERLNFDIAQALYWIGVDYHGGQWCPLLSLTSALGYSPGMGENGPEPDSAAFLLYAEIAQRLDSHFTG